jgi:hypothetical protein
LLKDIVQPVLVVIMSEMVVDWVKHGFITKFNHIRTSCYERYSDVLCKDVIVAAAFGKPVSSVSPAARRVSITCACDFLPAETEARLYLLRCSSSAMHRSQTSRLWSIADLASHRYLWLA